MTLQDFKYSSYPNPKFRRENFVMLNGEWDFAFIPSFELVDKFDKKIIVPYPYECLASGINDQTMHEFVIYRRTFEIDEICHHVLHFGGVDYECKVYVNGQEVAHHLGGYSAFQIFLRKVLVLGTNELIVLVRDSFDKYQLRGKQRTKETNYDCWYTQYTGIIRDVYLEKAGSVPVKCALFSGNQDGDLKYHIELLYESNINIIVSYQDKVVRDIIINNNSDVYEGLIHFDDIEYYSEHNPNLYDVKVISTGARKDIVETYFGFRSLETKDARIFINGHQTYLRMVLNQGYYPNQLITPTKEDVLRDILLIKEVGFNGVRIHQKVEVNLFYYLCDVLGIYIWNEIPSPYEFSKEMRDEFARELPRLIRQNYNSPSIIAHLLFNECWGVYQIREDKETQDFICEMADLVKELDDTRFIIYNDGWHQLTKSDILSLHDYEQNAETLFNEYKNLDYVLNEKIINTFGPALANGHKYNNQPIVISEFGGAALANSSGWGYGSKQNSLEEYHTQLRNIFHAVQSLDYLSGYCYTQLCDVEQETNGLFDENRVPKLPIKEYRKIILREE